MGMSCPHITLSLSAAASEAMCRVLLPPVPTSFCFDQSTYDIIWSSSMHAMRILFGQLILYMIPLPSHTLDVSLSLLSLPYRILDIS